MKFHKREIPKSEGSNLFFRLKDGETLNGVCRGEVYEFYIKWANNKSQVVTSDDPEGKSRFRVNIVVQEGQKFVAKVWEFGLTIYNQLSDINEEYDLSKTKLKIKRVGTGTDTIYMILPLLKEPLTPFVLNEIESVTLNMLQHKAPAQKSPAEAYFDGPPDELPF